eukprot:COSAG01_NODE_2481_length_7603_cov_4.629398_11_plen_651_part_01
MLSCLLQVEITGSGAVTGASTRSFRTFLYGSGITNATAQAGSWRVAWIVGRPVAFQRASCDGATSATNQSALGLSTTFGTAQYNQWGAAVLAPNGNIIGIPRANEKIIVVSPGSPPTVREFGLGPFSLSTTEKWSDGVLAPNGHVYCVPYSYNDVLVLNPIAETFVFNGCPSSVKCDQLQAQASRWSGGVLAPNGKIYGVPLRSTKVLLIDPGTQPSGFSAPHATVTPDAMQVASTATDKWEGGVLAPNGQIYCIPMGANSVMIIDPQTDSTDETSLGVATTAGKWANGVLAPNGKIYALPRNQRSVLIVDPRTNTIDVTSLNGLPTSSVKWTAAVLAPNGLIYGVPGRGISHMPATCGTTEPCPSRGAPWPATTQPRVLVVDPHTHTMFYDASLDELVHTHSNGINAQTQWRSGAVGSDGKVYMLPNYRADTLVITPWTRHFDFSNSCREVSCTRPNIYGQQTQPLVNRGHGVKCHSGAQYIMYSMQNVHTRFAASPPHILNANHFVCVKYPSNSEWWVDTGDHFEAFTAQRTDVLVYDISLNQALLGSPVPFHGLMQSYVFGDIGFISDRFNNETSAGDFEITGNTFQATYDLTYSGYNNEALQESSLLGASFNVTGLRCADGYQGSPVASPCEVDQEPYSLTGCQELT